MQRILPSLADILENAHVVSIPLANRMSFRGVTHREMVLFEGPQGWGEFGPFLEYADQESSRWLSAGIEAAWEGFPAPLRERIPVNATVPAVEPKAVGAVLDRFGPVPAVKIKVAESGQSPEEDVARVAAVRQALDKRGLSATGIRVDANMGWDIPTAVATLPRLMEYGLEYAEQPVAGIEGLAEVRAEMARLFGEGVVKIAADESVRKEEDPLKVARAGAADLIVIKAAPLGGVRRAVQIVAQAGLPAVVSSALDTSIGIRAGVALAAALPELPYACGLGTLALFDGDVSSIPMLPEHGELPVRTVSASNSLLQRFEATGQRRQWWLDRLARCHALLESRAEQRNKVS